MGSWYSLQPDHWARLVLGVLGGRVRVPLALVRDRVADFSEKVALDIQPTPPGLRIAGEAQALGAPISFSATIDADGVHVEGEHRTVRIQLRDVTLTTDDDAPGPLADAIRNGMIDTENPGTLIGNMMPLPPMITKAEGQDVIIDLMQVPAVRRDDTLRALLEVASSLLGVTGIDIEGDDIVLRLELLPGGSREAALSGARAVLTPVVRYLWPGGPP